MRVMDELSGEELADRSGVTAEQLRRLVELGIITPTPKGRFRPSDIQRIRVVDTLADAGFAPEQLSELIATGTYNLDWASVLFPEPTARGTTTLEQTAAATGLPEDLAARLFDAWELARHSGPMTTSSSTSPSRRWRASAATRRPCWARPGSSATACDGWPSHRCACSTPTWRSGWAPRAIRATHGATTSTRSPCP
jgi:DNA-binding transcriptional MerR regulator